MGDLLGLLFECLFFGIGLYMYLFAIGKVQSKNPSQAKKMNEFRKENATWMRLLGLAVMAIMFLNIVVHIQSML